MKLSSEAMTQWLLQNMTSKHGKSKNINTSKWVVWSCCESCDTKKSQYYVRVYTIGWTVKSSASHVNYFSENVLKK